MLPTESHGGKRRHFDLAAILNWFGSEHLQDRFGCQEHYPQLGTIFESSRYRISGRTDGQTTSPVIL